MKKELKLYYFPQCPFCQIVLNAIDQYKVEVSLNNIRLNEDHFKELIEVTNRQTVPCLFIDGVPMHESGDIISWIEENYSK
ncbi:MAG: glutaredoxin [Bdellovibrionales bacterium]|mgnify:CR=1 FL=1|jgi:glutaredoxin|nr:glutaredoxin [Bdellovibrionales bacterium]